MKEVTDSGKIGAIKTLIVPGGGLFNEGSHILGPTPYLNSDKPAVCVHGRVPHED